MGTLKVGSEIGNTEPIGAGCELSLVPAACGGSIECSEPLGAQGTDFLRHCYLCLSSIFHTSKWDVETRPLGEMPETEP